MRPTRAFLFWGPIVLYVGFCLFFIGSSSFVKDGVRYFSLFDDAMISMRFAKNFAAGHGLVWNAGDVPVEGYTNFLWTVYMAFWHLLPISAAKISLCIQLSGLFFLTASLVLVRNIAFNLTGNYSMALGACLLTALYQPINFWALRGMETSVMGFIVLLAAGYVFKAAEGRTVPSRFFFLLGTGILVRIDFAVLAFAMGAYAIFVSRENRFKNFFRGAGILFLFLGGVTAFRWVYYHDLVPNTYYLKTAGVPLIFRLKRGIDVTREFIKNFSPFLFFLPGMLYFSKDLKKEKVTFLFFLFLIQMAYSIWVGGDAWESWGHFANRYLCIVMPCFFILLALFFGRLVETGMIASEHGRYLKPWLLLALCLLAAGQIYAGNSVIDSSVLNRGPWGLHIEDDAGMVKKGLFLKEITTPEAKIGVIWAGATPYFSERYAIDFLGKSDAVIAHGKNRAWNWKKFYPGHNKYDYQYSIGILKPDVVVQIWDDFREAIPILKQFYIPFDAGEHGTMYLKKDSKNILWEGVFSREISRRLWGHVLKHLNEERGNSGLKFSPV